VPDRDRSRPRGDGDALSRLERRLSRERAARREAEAISERATRELYDKQQRLLLLGEVVRAANEASDVAHALATAIDAVCRHCGWRLGHAWLLAPDGRLDPTGLWSGAEDGCASFRAVTAGLRLAAGEGLPGRVLAARRAVWLPDIAQMPSLPRAAAAEQAGVRTAVGFPILVGSEVVGVLEFLSERALEPDAELIELMAQVGTELGRVVERQRAAELLRHQATHDALTWPSSSSTSTASRPSTTRSATPPATASCATSPPAWTASSAATTCSAASAATSS
jgi:transcriptional regulator with GAF, ATPase, and Fis domain